MELWSGYSQQRSKPKKDPGRGSRIDMDESVIDENQDKDNEVCPVAEYSRNLIEKELGQRLFTIADKINTKFNVDPGQSSVSDLFPLLPGSYLKLNNPALELVKAVCKVLSLDANVTESVERLKRDSLKLLKIEEFSIQGEWKDPCLSYVLPEMICKGCNHCSDLDLCRNPELVDADGNAKPWECEQCNLPYDVWDIEQVLLTHLNRLSMAFCLQDLKCIRCKQIKESHMGLFCECSDRFIHTLTPEEFGVKLRTFNNLAKFYNMEILSEAVDWTFAGNQRLQSMAE